MSDLYKDYLMHSSKKTLKRYKKSQKGNPEFLGTGATGRFVNTVNKDIETRGIQSPSRTTINPSEDTFTDRVRARSNARREARRVYNTDVIEKENAKKAIEETTHRHNTNSRSGGRIKPAVGDVRSNTEDPAIASARNSFQNAINDAINNVPENGPRAGHSTSSHSSNRMLSRRSVSKFSTFPNRNGGKSSESFWNSILQKARNNHQYIRMMTPNGEMSMSPEYWEELFGNGENAANYTYLGFGVTYDGRNTGYRPLNR